MTTRDSGAPKFLNCFPKIPNSAQRFADFYYVLFLNKLLIRNLLCVCIDKIKNRVKVSVK